MRQQFGKDIRDVVGSSSTFLGNSNKQKIARAEPISFPYQGWTYKFIIRKEFRKMKKKVVSIALAIIVMLTLTISALAGTEYGNGIFSEYVESYATEYSDRIVFNGKSYTGANLNLIDQHILQMIASDVTEDRILYTGTLSYDILNTKSLTYNCLIPEQYHSYEGVSVGVTYYKGAYSPYNQYIVAHDYVDFGWSKAASNETNEVKVAEETKKAEISRGVDAMREYCNDKIFESFSFDYSKYLNISQTIYDSFEGRHVYQLMSQIDITVGDTIPSYYYDEDTEIVIVVKQDENANNFMFVFGLNECGDYEVQDEKITKADSLYPEEYIAINREYVTLIGADSITND